MKVRVTDYTLYRWRYHIGYLGLALLVIGMLLLAALFVPGALRDGELESSIASGALSMHSIDPTTVIDLPYHILQRLSFLTFGVTIASIKLPSIVLGALTVVGVLLLIKTWFRRNIAVIVTAIAATTTQFLFLAQDGTPSIMFSFVTIWLLVACTYLTRVKVFGTFWKVVACVLMAIALYTPLGIYTVAALAIAAVFHPHIRYMIRRIARVRLVIAIILGLVTLIPLGEAIILNHSVALTLLGIPQTIDLQTNIISVSKNLFGFFLTSDGYLLRPLYSLGAIILIGAGVYRFLTVKYTARSYTVFFLGLFLIPLVIINPTHITDLYPLAVLFIAMGISMLVSDWYSLFPHNPYARIAGLIPISIFVVGMIFTGSAQYIDNYMYNVNILSYYNNDLPLLNHTLHTYNSSRTAPATVITTKAQEPFYTLVAHYDKRFTINGNTSKAHTIIVTHDQYRSFHPQDLTLSSIVTSQRAINADRFYVYKLSQ